MVGLESRGCLSQVKEGERRLSDEGYQVHIISKTVRQEG